MIYRIDTPVMLLESLAKDTRDNKIIWIQQNLAGMERYSVMIDIPKTKKYLKIDANDTYLKADFYSAGKRTSFEMIEGEIYFRSRLLQEIRKQIRL